MVAKREGSVENVDEIADLCNSLAHRLRGFRKRVRMSQKRHSWTVSPGTDFVGSSREFQELVMMVDAILKRCEASLRKKLIGPSAKLILAELRDGRRFQFARMVRYGSSVSTRDREDVDEEARERQAMMVGILDVLIRAEMEGILGGKSMESAREIVMKLVCQYGLAPQANFVKRWAIKLHGGYVCLIDGELNGGALLEEAEVFSLESQAWAFVSRNRTVQHTGGVPVEVEVLKD